MQIVIKGKNINVKDNLREYTEEKINKLGKYFDNLIQAEVEFTKEAAQNSDRKYKTEVTIWASGRVIRGEVETDEFFKSVDLVVEKLERQIKKHKDKLRKYTNKRKRARVKEEKGEENLKDLKLEDKLDRIVRIKRFPLKPMDTEEATLQMELLGHNFFVFTNAESGKVNVLYKRKDGDYGLIEPQR